MKSSNSLNKEKYENALKELKNKYSMGRMSALIGSGFSKNAFSEFPDWDELLYDMCLYLFENEIEQQYKNFFLYKKLPARNLHGTKWFQNMNEFKKAKVSDIIKREGYLNIVSKYISKKGYREAIEIYIEERIPYVSNIESRICIFGPKEKVTEITDETFSLHRKLLEGRWERIYTTNYDNLLESAATLSGKQWEMIDNASNLSLFDTKKNIIKIHGSIWDKNNIEQKKEERFSFDGCHNHRYIISKEDYDSYMNNHEAFAQLMRISLLQGAFCLIGFSGNDPNFLSWLRWVKDILLKSKNKKDNTKVYIITIDDKEPNDALRLFYENHHICAIPLGNSLVKSIIGVNDNVVSPKSLLDSFFDYIYDSEKNNYYYNLWQKCYSIERNKILIDNNKLRDIKLIHSNYRLLKQTYLQYNYLLRLRSCENLTQEQIELAIIALEDTNLSPVYFSINEKIEQSEELTEEIRQKYQLVINRFKILKGQRINNKNDAVDFEEILNLAFQLEFSKLKEKLEKWNPVDFRRQHKATLLYLFEKSRAESEILSYINDNKVDEKEKYYATQLANLMSGQHPIPYSTANYENQGLDGLYDISDFLINEISKKKEKIQPYGISDTIIHFGNDNISYEKSVQFLQFLIESGSLLRFGSFVFLNDSDWYQVFEQLHEYYPFPCLFYSLQCSDKNVLRRIGQDFAYSDKVLKVVPILLKKILDNIVNDSMPDVFKGASLRIAAQLFVSVKITVWQDQFMEIWRNELLPNYASIESAFHPLYDFITKGLVFLSNSEYKQAIISDCLLHSKEQLDNTINYFYYLNKNGVKKSPELKKNIDHFCENISDSREVTIAWNIRKLLSEKNINDVLSYITTFQHNSNVPDVVLYTFTYFVSHNKRDTSAIMQVIISHPELWDNGIHDKGASPPNYLRLSRFEKSIKWSKEELTSIYLKLESSLHTLLESNHYKSDKSPLTVLMHYDKLFYEMFDFLRKNEKTLQTLDSFEETKKLVSTELYKTRGFEDINLGLISDDRDKIIAALNELYELVRIKGIDAYLYSFRLIISHFLMVKTTAPFECIYFISYYLRTYFKDLKNPIPEDISKSLMYGIDKYKKETIQKLNMDLPKGMLYLTEIATVLNTHGISSSGVDYWLRVKKSRRFDWDRIKIL